MRRWALIPAVLGLLAALAGCVPGPDPDQARLCRLAFVALADRDTTLTIESQQAMPADQGGSVVEILALQRDGQNNVRPRWLVCHFATPTGATLQALRAVTLDRRALSGPSLFFLKRFWLATQDADASDPEPVALWHGAPRLAPALAHGLQDALAAVPGLAIYGFLAAAYALVYGLIGRINLAFGATAAVGGAAALAGVGLAGSPLTIAGMVAAALLAALWAGAWHGFAIARWVFHPLRRATGQQGLVATVGLALVIEEYLRIAQGPAPAWITPLRTVPIGIATAPGFTVTVTPLSLAIAAVAGASALILLAVMAATQFGRDWRAMADDAQAAALMGIDPARLLAITVALASALAAAAGAVTVLAYGTFGSSFGTIVGLKALLAAVVGGIGSVPGAMAGAVLIALAETLWSALFPIEFRDLALFTALSILLVMRPGGLFGFKDLTPRRV